jgi:hypothetical protein
MMRIPGDALPGSLSLTHHACGTPNCHCEKAPGHVRWQLTFMSKGKKCVHYIPVAWVDSVRARVETGRQFKEAVAELFAINAQLQALERKQSR